MAEEIKLIAPCFGCMHTYNCKYWKNPVWMQWALTYHMCPALLYPYDYFLTIYKETTHRDPYSNEQIPEIHEWGSDVFRFPK